MPQQILTPSGASIWNHRDCQFVGDIQHGDKSTVLWRDTNWFLKFNDHSVNEVIGYRLADFLGLPVQPWLAVEMDKIEDTGVDVPHVAILIQVGKSAPVDAIAISRRKTSNYHRKSARTRQPNNG